MNLHLEVEKLSLTINHPVYIANTVHLFFLMALRRAQLGLSVKGSAGMGALS